MRALFLVTALLILGAGSASASCNATGNRDMPVFCSADPPSPPLPIPSNVRCTTVERLTGICDFKSMSGDARQARERKGVATLIVQGDCDGAIKRALSENDFETAEHVKSLCTPAPPPAQGPPFGWNAFSPYRPLYVPPTSALITNPADPSH